MTEEETRRKPYSINSYDTQGEFPDRCVAVRIVGPNFPINGSPFITFESDPERTIWASRWVAALNAAYDAGATSMAKACLAAAVMAARERSGGK